MDWRRHLLSVVLGRGHARGVGIGIGLGWPKGARSRLHGRGLWLVLWILRHAARRLRLGVVRRAARHVVMLCAHIGLLWIHAADVAVERARATALRRVAILLRRILRLGGERRGKRLWRRHRWRGRSPQAKSLVDAGKRGSHARQRGSVAAAAVVRRRVDRAEPRRGARRARGVVRLRGL
jgi:hypothetical protein